VFSAVDLGQGTLLLDQKWTIQRHWQQDEKNKKQKHNTICVGYHYMQTSTNNVNKT
jgi:hypothetical protein